MSWVGWVDPAAGVADEIKELTRFEFDSVACCTILPSFSDVSAAEKEDSMVFAAQLSWRCENVTLLARRRALTLEREARELDHSIRLRTNAAWMQTQNDGSENGYGPTPSDDS